jgi:hypothetical protein
LGARKYNRRYRMRRGEKKLAFIDVQCVDSPHAATPGCVPARFTL